VGAHWLSTKELPDQQWQAKPYHGALAQLLLISSHHLVEMMLFHCIKEIFNKNHGIFLKHEKQLSQARFNDAFIKWPKELGFNSFDINVQPYASIKRLQERRNSTIHKDSALTSLKMAKSALWSAVEGSREIAVHFRGAGGFPYENVLKKYPLPVQPWLTDIEFIDRAL
jgi:hypothetical protein